MVRKGSLNASFTTYNAEPLEHGAAAVTLVLRLLVELPVAFAVTFFAIRVLGVRRSWIGWMLAGTFGWVTGNLRAVAATGSDWGAARLSVETVAFSAVLTM